MNILIILFTILFAVLSWKRLDWATALVLILLPTYQIRFSLLGLPLTLLEVMVVILFLAWFIKSWQEKELPSFLSFPSRSAREESSQNIKPYPFSYEIIAILIIAFISVVVAGFSNSALGILKAYFIEPIMFFIVFVNVYHVKSRDSGERSEFNMVFLALAISAFLISIAAIYQKITGQFIPAEWIIGNRMTGLFNYPNAVGLYLGPIVVLLLGWFMSLRAESEAIPRSPRRFVPIIIGTTLLAMTILVVYLAKSEGALIGVVAALVVFGLLYNKLSRKVVVGLLVIGAIILSFNASLRTDVYKKISLQDKDGQIRIQLWKETWEMLKDNHFIFGAGLANYQNAIVPYHQSGIYVRNDDPEFDKMVRISLEYQQQVWQPLEIYLYPHNIFLNFWVELGLAGMLLFSWVIGKYLFLGYRLQIADYKNRGIILGLLGAMIVLVVHGLVDAPYFKNDLAIIFWVLIAILGVINLQLTTNKK